MGNYNENKRSLTMNVLNKKAMALSFGITWGVALFIFGLISMFGWGTYLVDVLSSVYIWYGPSFIGAIFGGMWGFIDGVIGGFVIAWLYNMFLPACVNPQEK